MKRALFQVVVFLVLGAIVNLAVAWGCAWNARGDIMTRRPDERGFMRGPLRTTIFVMHKEFGVTRVHINIWHDPVSVQIVNTPEKNPPAWARRVIENAGDAIHGFPIVAAGFPLRSFQCYWIMPNQTIGAIELPSRPGGAQRGLPFEPIWSGLILNTFIYAALTWMLIIAPRRLRSARRRVRKLCPDCAYPIGASEVCTECGAAIAR